MYAFCVGVFIILNLLMVRYDVFVSHILDNIVVNRKIRTIKVGMFVRILRTLSTTVSNYLRIRRNKFNINYLYMSIYVVLVYLR